MALKRREEVLMAYMAHLDCRVGGREVKHHRKG
jgi:hypothetical protein